MSIALLGLLAVLVSGCGLVHARTDLWRVVHNICAPSAALTGTGFPCLKVDRDRGYAVIRSPNDRSQILIVPLVQLDGIENPALLQGKLPNYWLYAWSERNYVATAAGRPLGWNDIGMAINPATMRDQDQLHIHVDCVDARVKARLGARTISDSHWTPFDFAPISGHYLAKRFSAADLDRDPFRIVAAELPAARADMATYSIGVIGVSDRAGDDFVILASRDGSAEDLLDHHCVASR